MELRIKNWVCSCGGGGGGGGGLGIKSSEGQSCAFCLQLSFFLLFFFSCLFFCSTCVVCVFSKLRFVLVL